MLFDARKECTRLLDVEHINLFNHICSQLDPIHHRALLRVNVNDYQCASSGRRRQEIESIVIWLHNPTSGNKNDG